MFKRNSKRTVAGMVLLFLFSINTIKAENPADFELKSATGGSIFRLSDAKGNFVVLHFLLKTECPHCLRHTSEYISKSGALTNVVQVFIKPDEEKDILKWANKLPADELNDFPVYQDPGAGLAKQFAIPDGYKFHNQVVHYPALVLLGPDGKEIFRYVGKNNADRFPFDQLVDKIRELSVR